MSSDLAKTTEDRTYVPPNNGLQRTALRAAAEAER